jgi:chemotaxis signal transduction protein
MLLTSCEPTVLADRYLLTAVGKYTLVLPATWVSEVLQVEQNKVLQMPHYLPAILGVANHQNSFLTLVAGWQFLPEIQPSRVDYYTVLYLVTNVNNWQNTGIVVDRVLGSMVKKDFPSTTLKDLFVMANPQLLPSHLWQPLNRNLQHQ